MQISNQEAIEKDADNLLSHMERGLLDRQINHPFRDHILSATDYYMYNEQISGRYKNAKYYFSSH